jgi:hypothetical protein
VNPRPWDQHPIGRSCGVDLMYIAYCDYAGLPAPGLAPHFMPRKWIAEDAFFMALLRLLWRRDPGVRSLVRQTRGRKTFAIWSVKDPLPFVAYTAALIPKLFVLGFQALFPRARVNARQSEPTTV